MNATGENWSAEETAGGWAIMYDPTPSPVKNADGTKSFGLRFPAFVAGVILGTPEQATKDVASILNQHKTLVAEIDRLKAELKSIDRACDWYWPEDDTSSDACANSPHEIAQNNETPPGELFGYSPEGVTTMAEAKKEAVRGACLDKGGANG